MMDKSKDTRIRHRETNEPAIENKSDKSILEGVLEKSPNVRIMRVNLFSEVEQNAVKDFDKDLVKKRNRSRTYAEKFTLEQKEAYNPDSKIVGVEKTDELVRKEISDKKKLSEEGNDFREESSRDFFYKRDKFFENEKKSNDHNNAIKESKELLEEERKGEKISNQKNVSIERNQKISESKRDDNVSDTRIEKKLNETKAKSENDRLENSKEELDFEKKEKKNDIPYIMWVKDVKKDANKYRKEFITKIDDFIKILNKNLELSLSEDFREESIRMYDDILNSIECKENEDRFKIFRESFKKRKVKGPQFVAAAILYNCLTRNNRKINQRILAENFNLSKEGISTTTSTISMYFKKIPKIDFIYDIIPANSLTKNDFENSVQKYIDIFLDSLSKDDLIDPALSDIDKKNIMGMYHKIINSMEGQEKFNVFYKKLVKKKPKIIAAALNFLYIKYEKDVDLYKKDFLKILDRQGRIHIPSTNFTEITHQFITKFFEINSELYQKKVEGFLKEHIKKIKKSILNSSRDKSQVNILIKKLNQELEKKALSIFDVAINNKFQIVQLDQKNEVDYYTPQKMSFSLIFFTLKTIQGLEDLATPNKLEQYFGNIYNFKHINDISSNRLYAFIKDFIGRYKGQEYSRESFIEMMRHSLKEFYHIETDFLLNLYEMLHLTPVEFGNKLAIHETLGTSGVLRVIRNKTSFTEPQTFTNLRKFIKGSLSGKNQDIALSWINDIQNLKRKDYIDQSVTYPFRWNEERLEKIEDKQLKSSISEFLDKIWKADFPREVFMSETNPRASMLKFLGTPSEPLNFNKIKDFFKDKLTRYDSSYELCRNVREVFDNYRDLKIGKIPDHPLVLNYILKSNKNAIAIESPIWKKIKKSKNTYIGHIDIILHQEGSLILGDYKQNEIKIFKGLPQIMAYGLMLKERLLEEFGVNLKNKILCVGFSRDVAYSFDPEVLYSVILNFIEAINHKRGIPLLSRKIPKMAKRTDLYKDILKLK